MVSKSRRAEELLPCGRSRPKAEYALKAMPELLDRLDIHAAKKKLKKSRARKLILKVIVEEMRHFTVPELVQKVQKHKSSVAFATIYRSVPVFVDAGIIKKSLLSTMGQAVYELDFGSHHDHLVCSDCNELFEFESPKIELFLPVIARQFGLSLTTHAHVLVGKCQYFKAQHE